MKALGLVFFGFCLFACTDHKTNFTSPPGYDLNKPVVYKMPQSLFEISGIAFHNEDKSILLAEQDEEGAVYILRQQNNTIDLVGKTVFRTHGDFEDIAICNNTVLMLQSDGRIFTFPFSEIAPGKEITANRQQGILPEGEYESLYADNATGKIYVLCKNCAKDEKKGHKHISGYIFHTDQNGILSRSGTFQISAHEIATLAGMKKITFKASALTFNRWTNEWYILSSVNKMLVTAGTDWKVKRIFRLDPRLYMQPEGIAFDKDRTLYISSEGGTGKNGTIFKFIFHPAA